MSKHQSPKAMYVCMHVYDCNAQARENTTPGMSRNPSTGCEVQLETEQAACPDLRPFNIEPKGQVP